MNRLIGFNPYNLFSLRLFEPFSKYSDIPVAVYFIRIR